MGSGGGVAGRIARGDIRLYRFAPPDNLHNAVTISQDRLGKRVAHLGAPRMKEICTALRFSLGCDLSQP